MDEQKTSEGERLVKLALFIKEHAPVSFATIRGQLHEYAYYTGNDPDEQRKCDYKARRAFERDKATLESCGLMIVADAHNQYSLDTTSSYAAPVDLTPSQASLLRLVCASLLEDESYPLKSELRMVLAKIGDELELPDMLPGFHSSPQPKELPGFKKVRKAVSSRKLLSFDYADSKGRSTSREVEPLGCYFLNKHCYVVAWDRGREGERVFRLDRMSRIHVNTSRPAVPDFDARPLHMQDWVRLPFQIGAEPFTAIVEFDAGNTWRTPALCVGQGTLEETDDGAVWTVEARDPLALAQWCIEHGPGVRPAPDTPARPYYNALLKAAVENHAGVL